MADTEIQGSFNIGGQEFTIAELAGINMSGVKAVRAVRLPSGLYKFVVSDCDFAPREYQDKDGSTKKSVAIAVACEVKEIHFAFEWPAKTRIEDSDVLASLIEKKHYESFFNKASILDMIGAYKAFLVDIGFTTDGEEVELKELMNRCVGYEFMGMIKWSKNKDDPDMPYINLNRHKIASVENLSTIKV